MTGIETGGAGSPNEQNSEWGIETKLLASFSQQRQQVRTNRIPNGELKQGCPPAPAALPGSPNEQNSEWGIETLEIIGPGDPLGPSERTEFRMGN